MTPRAWSWVAALMAADVVAFVLTIHALATYHPAPNGPSVTTLGQVLGWIISFGLLIVVILIVLASRQAARYAARRPPPPSGPAHQK